MVATEFISSLPEAELSMLPKQPRVEYATGKFDTDLVSVEGQCLALLEDAGQLKPAAADLQRFMIQSNSATGLVVISPESRVVDFEYFIVSPPIVMISPASAQAVCATSCCAPA